MLGLSAGLYLKRRTESVSVGDTTKTSLLWQKYIFTVIAHLAPIHQSNLDFILARRKLDWNTERHIKLINETKSNNLKCRFIHLTNETMYWWLIAVSCWRMTHSHCVCCTGEATRSTGTWPKPHNSTPQKPLAEKLWNTTCKHTVVYTALLSNRKLISHSNSPIENKTIAHLCLDPSAQQQYYTHELLCSPWFIMCEIPFLIFVSSGTIPRISTGSFLLFFFF